MSRPGEVAADAASGESFPGLPQRYRVKSFLGRGSQKRVFLAEDTLLARDVAVAVIDGRSLTPDNLERLHEARAMARIGGHPHVVSIHDVIERPDAVYIVTRYLPGGDLATRLAGLADALPVAEVLRIGIQVCQALEHAHERGVVHRDLKPGNLFLDDRDDVFLGDFGLAGVEGAGAEGAPGRVAGTPEYMAPEQIGGADVGAACDLYALGCVLYELATGAPPFSGAAPAEVLRRQQLSEPAPPERAGPGLPLLLRELILRLLAKPARERPASARDVRAALEGILGAGAAEPEDERLVARDAELRFLERCLARAADGQPGLVLLPGEAGVGKSRLLRELCARAQRSGMLTLLGAGHEELRLPYRPFVEALAPLAFRIGERDPEDGELLRRFLGLAGARGPAAPVSPPDSERHRLVAAVFDALAAWSRDRALLLVLDDLHWADSATLDLFEQLARAIAQRAASGGLRLLLVVGFRPEEARERLDPVFAQLPGEPVTRSVALPGLDDDSIYELLRELGIPLPSDQLVQRIREATGGNPLFIRTVLAHLQRSGALDERGGFTVSAGDATELEIPDSVSKAIAARVAGLTGTCRDLLTLASFLGARFDTARLAGLTEREADAVETMLGEALAQGLVVGEKRAYRFAHPLIRHVLYHEPDPERRARIHLRVAELLEGFGAGGRDALEIAHHLIRAGDAADGARTSRWASEAGDQALARFAWNEAAELFEAALRSGERARALGVRARAELHHKAGYAFLCRFDSGPCLHHFDCAIEAFREAGDVRGLAVVLAERIRARQQAGQVAYGELGDVQQLEEVGRQLDEEDYALRASVLGYLVEAHWLAQQTRKAETLAAECFRLASAAGDDALCAEASIWLGIVNLQDLNLDGALSNFRSGLAHARRARDLLRAGRCLQRIPMILYLTGRLEEAERTAMEALKQHEVVQSPGDQALTLAMLVVLAAIRGDAETAERRAEEVLGLVRRAKFLWAGAVALPALAYLRAMRQDWSGAQQALDRLLEPGVVFDDPAPIAGFTRQYSRLLEHYAGEALVLEQGELDASALPKGEESFDIALVPALCAHVELCEAVQAGGVAENVEASLALAERHGVVFSLGWPFFVPRIQGAAAALCQRWDDAERHLVRSMELAEAVGAWAELARSRLECARVLAIRNAAGDRRRAGELLRLALPVLAERCPETFRVRAQRLADFLEEHPE